MQTTSSVHGSPHGSGLASVGRHLNRLASSVSFRCNPNGNAIEHDPLLPFFALAVATRGQLHRGDRPSRPVLGGQTHSGGGICPRNNVLSFPRNLLRAFPGHIQIQPDGSRDIPWRAGQVQRGLGKGRPFQDRAGNLRGTSQSCSRGLSALLAHEIMQPLLAS